MRFFSEKNSGLTIIETLIVVGLLAMLMLVITTFQADVFKKNRELGESITAVYEARKALKTMVSEIRIANAANTGAYPIATASSTEFSFYADGNNDSIYDRIRYFYSNGNLMRGVIVPTGSPLSYNPANETISTLVHDVVNSQTGIFFYFDEGYTGTEDPLAVPFNTSDIRLVRMMIVVDKSTTTQPAAISEESTVFIRTFKTDN